MAFGTFKFANFLNIFSNLFAYNNPIYLEFATTRQVVIVDNQFAYNFDFRVSKENNNFLVNDLILSNTYNFEPETNSALYFRFDFVPIIVSNVQVYQLIINAYSVFVVDNIPYDSNFWCSIDVNFTIDNKLSYFNYSFPISTIYDYYITDNDDNITLTNEILDNNTLLTCTTFNYSLYNSDYFISVPTTCNKFRFLNYYVDGRYDPLTYGTTTDYDIYGNLYDIAYREGYWTGSNESAVFYDDIIYELNQQITNLNDANLLLLNRIDSLDNVNVNLNNLVWSIFDSPLRVISQMLNFNIFGVNVASMLFGVLTLLIIIWVIRKVV